MSSWSLIFTLVAASISHFLTAAIKLSCYSSNEISLLFFIFRSSSFSVIHVNVDIEIKIERNYRHCCCCFFISKSPGGYAIARVLEMQNFTPTYMMGWTRGRFSQNQYFLDAQTTKFSYPWYSAVRASRALERPVNSTPSPAV